jgi:Toprim domain/Zinc-binding domain of primase-helicase
MSYHRKPPIATHLVDKARGASFMQVYQGLGLTLKKIGPHELSGPCPRCGGTDRFNLNTSKGTWFCRGCKAKGGDALSILMHARGLDFREAVEDLTGESADDLRPVPAPIEAKAKPAKDDAAREAFILRMAAKAIARMRPIAGTDGESYLREVRKINTGALADVLNSTASIGWHPAVYFNEDGHALHDKRIGAIIAVMTDAVTGKPTGGISRTYVHEGRKVTKSKGLGPAGIVRLTPDEDVTNGLHLAEGLETALDMMAKGLRPMWSCGSTSIMAKMPVVSGIECLTILADHDENGAGERAALELEQRWREAGREVLVVAPAAPGDFNDITMRGSL